MWTRTLDARRCRILVATLVTLSSLLLGAEARATLPTFLDQGFALETLDPAPAGSRFIVTPDAPQSNVVSTRAITDYAAQPLALNVGGAPGTSAAASSSYGVFTHAGVSTTMGECFMLSLNVPIVLSQSVSVSAPDRGFPPGTVTPDPEPGDVGDIRFGAMLSLPRRLRSSWLIRHNANVAVAFDAWAPTGNSQDLTGEPAPRFRAMLVGSGEVRLLPGGGSVPLLEYALALGYQQYFSSVGDIGLDQGAPIRAALGFSIPIRPRQNPTAAVKIRPSVEYFGTVAVESSPDFPRGPREMLFNALVDFRGAWSAGASIGAGESHAPGTPAWRALTVIQFRAPYRDAPRGPEPTAAAAATPETTYVRRLALEQAPAARLCNASDGSGALG
jgi:hypothetical protein